MDDEYLGNWRDVLIVGVVFVALLVMVYYALYVRESKSTMEIQYDTFARCIEMEYERDFCLALVGDE